MKKENFLRRGTGLPDRSPPCDQSETDDGSNISDDMQTQMPFNLWHIDKNKSKSSNAFLFFFFPFKKEKKSFHLFQKSTEKYVRQKVIPTMSNV